AAAGGELSGVLHEAGGGQDLAVEVGGVQRAPPDGLVDLAQPGDGEGGREEGGGQGGVLQFGPGALHRVGNDAGVVEGGFDAGPRPLPVAQVGPGDPGGLGGVPAG